MISRACSTVTPLCLRKLGVLLGELVAQLAGLRVEHRRRRQVDAQFGCAGTDLRFLAEDRQLGDTALQQPARRREDAVVLALGQHDALAVRAGPVQQLVGEHLRSDHRRDRNRQLRQQIRGVDVGVHQRECGVDLALRGRGDPAAGRGDPAGRLERAESGGDDRQPQAQPGHQRGDRRVQLAARR